MAAPVTILLADDFMGSVRSAPSSSSWVAPGGTCSWPLALFEKHAGGHNSGRWSVVSNGAAAAAPEPAPEPAPDIPAWLEDYPGASWRDIVKVAKGLGYVVRSKTEAMALLACVTSEAGESLTLDAFNAILADINGSD